MENQKLKQDIRYIVLNILVAALASVFLVNYVAAAYRIKGNSMDTTLRNEERVIISRLTLRTGIISRFDIVVLTKPSEPGKSIIKRVIGLPGEIVEIREGDIYINNKKLEQPFLEGTGTIANKAENMKPLPLEPDHYFVMGDNRAISQDSRTFGPVRAECIYGITLFRYWPLSRWGKIK